MHIFTPYFYLTSELLDIVVYTFAQQAKNLQFSPEMMHRCFSDLQGDPLHREQLYFRPVTARDVNCPAELMCFHGQ